MKLEWQTVSNAGLWQVFLFNRGYAWSRRVRPAGERVPWFEAQVLRFGRDNTCGVGLVDAATIEERDAAVEEDLTSPLPGGNKDYRMMPWLYFKQNKTGTFGHYITKSTATNPFGLFCWWTFSPDGLASGFTTDLDEGVQEVWRRLRKYGVTLNIIYGNQI